MPSLPCSPFDPSGPWDPCDPCGPCTPMLPWSPCVKWKWTPTLRPRTSSNVFSQHCCIASWKALLSVLPAVLQVTQRHFAQSRTRPYQLQITGCCNSQHWKQLRSYVHFQLTMQQQQQNSTKWSNTGARQVERICCLSYFVIMPIDDILLRWFSVSKYIY